jgi:hypothetical protein
MQPRRAAATLPRRQGGQTDHDVRRFPLWLQTAVLTAAALGLAAALRFLVIEQPQYGWACQSLAPPWWCPIRMAGIYAIRLGLFGFIALIAGALAVLRRRPLAAQLAVVLGAAGLILYVPEPAAGGALLGALAMVRR